ncbi:hypothetical protein AAKU64_001815 [Undibacterium sp. GrIS 1.8]
MHCALLFQLDTKIGLHIQHRPTSVKSLPIIKLIYGLDLLRQILFDNRVGGGFCLLHRLT